MEVAGPATTGHTSNTPDPDFWEVVMVPAKTESLVDCHRADVDDASAGMGLVDMDACPRCFVLLCALY